ncbi:MAG: 4-hydroxythreonine-4-phosphate dehydrogenase PdxA [Acidobacteria bacterium]|nr:4-hydroxythreonine-4-phosphate dehydrogenase PdxA [Acidobacteriota bacterium]
MKPLIISAGDPAGIGPEIISLALESIEAECPIRIVCDWNLTRQSLEACGIEPWAVQPRRIDELPRSDEAFAVIDVATSGKHRLEPGVHDGTTGLAALRSIELAATLAADSRALVTGPISKAAIREVAPDFTGHTELLAKRAGLARYGRDFAMFFDSPTLRVVLLTVHEPLADAIRSISAASIVDLARLTTREISRLFGKNPRIAVAALNPHAGEGGAFGREETIIREGVEMARDAGMDVSGPFPADTVFHLVRLRRYDVVMAMFHDQGLIPVKTLHFDDAVNVTLGLPYLRASPDHGTAPDIAGKGIADAGPMRYAIEWALARSRELEAER